MVAPLHSPCAIPHRPALGPLARVDSCRR
uniref:Uncharacterized protein n=1 Tax=Arundo donax TaxID=35708 RepID=A0A0A9BIB7_ARUDO